MAKMCRPENLRFLLLIALYMVYLVCGALLFAFIERPVEEDLRSDLEASIRKFVVDHRQCMSESELIDLLEFVITTENRGVPVARRNDSTSTNWNLGQAIFFAASIVTTIGYGNVTPLSEGGRIFCLFYGFFGVIITAILLETVVSKLLLPTTTALIKLVNWFICCRCWSRDRQFALLSRRLIRLSFLAAFALTLAFIVPAVIFEYLEENWSFFDAFYFCFISLMTIGLGDYIPAENTSHQQHSTLYKICTTVYLYLGLVIVLLVVRSVYLVPELNFHKYFCTVNSSIQIEEEEKELEKLESQADLTMDTEDVRLIPEMAVKPIVVADGVYRTFS